MIFISYLLQYIINKFRHWYFKRTASEMASLAELKVPYTKLQYTLLSRALSLSKAVQPLG